MDREEARAKALRLVQKYKKYILKRATTTLECVSLDNHLTFFNIRDSANVVWMQIYIAADVRKGTGYVDIAVYIDRDTGEVTIHE